MNSSDFDDSPELRAKMEREFALQREFTLVNEASHSLKELKRLKASGVNLDATDTRGNTVLHLAAAAAPVPETVKNLCEAGASIEQRTLSWVRNNMDRFADSAIWLARSKEIEQLLLEHQRRRTIQEHRRSQKVCILCGKPLSFLGRLFNRDRHSGCESFSE
jgi:hypothetical protein